MSCVKLSMRVLFKTFEISCDVVRLVPLEEVKMVLPGQLITSEGGFKYSDEMLSDEMVMLDA